MRGSYLLLLLYSHLGTRAINLPVNDMKVVTADEWWLFACQQMERHGMTWKGMASQFVVLKLYLRL